MAQQFQTDRHSRIAQVWSQRTQRLLQSELAQEPWPVRARLTLLLPTAPLLRFRPVRPCDRALQTRGKCPPAVLTRLCWRPTQGLVLHRRCVRELRQRTRLHLRDTSWSAVCEKRAL